MSELSEEWFKVLMDESLPEDEARALAKKLFEGGAVSTSNKYRTVSSCPEGKTWTEALEAADSKAAARLRENMEYAAKQEYARYYAEREGLQSKLDLRTWRIFKAFERGEI